jgi:Family of unknown function (DUF6477)
MSRQEAAGRNFDRTVPTVHEDSSSNASASAARYVRARDLPKLLPLWPHEIETLSGADHARLLAKLRRSLRSERQRGLSGHWTYDLARHVQLLRAYRAETASYLRARCADAPMPPLGRA